MYGDGRHAHRCDCGNIWYHTDACAGNIPAHTCKLCGRQSWWKYHVRIPLRAVIETCQRAVRW